MQYHFRNFYDIPNLDSGTDASPWEQGEVPRRGGGDGNMDIALLGGQCYKAVSQFHPLSQLR